MSTAVTASTAGQRSDEIRRARQGLLVFAAFLAPLSLFGYWFNIAFPDLPLNLPYWPLGFAPGLAGVLTRLVRREGFADVSFRWPRRARQAALLAFGLPLVVGTIGFGAAYLLRLVEFVPPAFPVAVSPPAAQFGVFLAFTLTIGLLLTLPAAGVGEEIGWRGYLLPRLIQADVPQPILISVLIWGAWHIPIVVAGVYLAGSSTPFTIVMLMITAAAAGFILAWLRLGTGSIWPCVLLHAAWNDIINGTFMPATHGANARLWVGETGILVVLVLLLITPLVRRAWRS